jgi:hypothetical protein
MAGRPVAVNGALYRFGQDCGKTYGHRVKVYKVTKLSATEYEEEEVREGLGWDPTNGREGESAWNGERHHHMDAHQLPTGEPAVAAVPKHSMGVPRCCCAGLSGRD